MTEIPRALDPTPLFQSLAVKGKTIPNRIVMPPMVTRLDIVSENGINWYREHAAGGVGLAIVEATSVTLFGQELTVDNLTPLVDAIHDQGVLAAIQLFPVEWELRKDMPQDLVRPDIDAMLTNYCRATEICGKAGFDGVEVHGAHDFVLNRFFSPEQNERHDDYGGALENRMRLGVEIVETITSVCSDNEMLLLYRHTPVGPGYGVDDSLTLARNLVEAGVDILDLSPSSIDVPGDLAEPFKSLGVPLITVNELHHPERALEVLENDSADLIAIGRGLIADPEWANKVRERKYSDLVMCIGCNQKCFGNLEAGIPIGCVLH